METVLKLPPIRVTAPAEYEALMDWRRPKGTEAVVPIREFL
jgi:hypothetical protein